MTAQPYTVPQLLREVKARMAVETMTGEAFVVGLAENTVLVRTIEKAGVSLDEARALCCASESKPAAGSAFVRNAPQIVPKIRQAMIERGHESPQPANMPNVTPLAAEFVALCWDPEFLSEAERKRRNGEPLVAGSFQHSHVRGLVDFTCALLETLSTYADEDLKSRLKHAAAIVGRDGLGEPPGHKANTS
jgi:hypothetical protein